MQHFLPKRSSSAAGSSHPRSAPTPQLAKPAQLAAQPEPKPAPRECSRSARRHPPPKRKGPRPKIVLTRRPRRHPNLWDRKRRGLSLAVAGPPPKLPWLDLQAPCPVPGAEGDVFIAVTGPVQAPKRPTAVIAERIKHNHSQKESKFPLPHNTRGTSPHGDKPLESIQPLVMRAKAWQAIPGVSDWVMRIIKRGYSMQFARRPPRFSGVVPTSVQSEDA